MEARTITMAPLKKDRIRTIGLIALRGLLSLVLLVILFQFVNLADVAASMVKARFEYVGGALILVLANLGLQVLKWRYFVRLINPASSNLETTGSLLFGITLGAITPGQLGEFGGRALTHSSVSPGGILGLTLVDKLQTMCIMGIAGIVSLTLLLHLPMAIAAICDVLVLAFGLTFFFNPGVVVWILSKVRRSFLEKAWVRDFMEAVQIFRFDHLLVAFALTCFFYLVLFIQMFLLLNAFGSVGLYDAFLGFAAMMFLKALIPISLGDLGVREASSVYFYSLRGIAHGTSLNASLLLFVLNVMLPSILGLIFMPKSWSR
jgi:uncharacterized protein (TIRG00374 family)